MFRRAIRRRAVVLQSGWKGIGVLPELVANSNNIVQFLTSVWEWEDRCLESMRGFRDKSDKLYDYSPFEDAFGSLSRLRNLYGKEARECAEALRKYRESCN